MPTYKHDFNPDKEATHTHKYFAVNTNPQNESIQMPDGSQRKFDSDGKVEITDPGVADEMRKYVDPTTATITRVRNDHPSDRGHTYSFVVPALPWHRYDANGNRIYDE